MLQELIWNDLKCTMDAEVWRESGAEYEDLPVKLTFCEKEADVSFSINLVDMDEENVCRLLREFLDNWQEMQMKILKAIYDAFQFCLTDRRIPFENGENSEMNINSPEEMAEYLSLTTLVVGEYPHHGLCVGLGFGEEWDVHFDDYEDVGVRISDGKVVAVSSSVVIM